MVVKPSDGVGQGVSQGDGGKTNYVFAGILEKMNKKKFQKCMKSMWSSTGDAL